MDMIAQKIEQAVGILDELGIDAWLTFVRESATLPDPVIDMVVGQHCTWQTAWLVFHSGRTVAIAGSLARKRQSPPTSGTFPTDTLTFSLLLVGVIVIVGALTFFPALALSPIVEHWRMTGGRLF